MNLASEERRMLGYAGSRGPLSRVGGQWTIRGALSVDPYGLRSYLPSRMAVRPTVAAYEFL